MKQHPMPVLTEQQREEAIKFNIDVIAQCDRMLNAICHSDDRPKFEQHKLSAQITLAALTAEPKLWSYWFDSNLHYQEARFGRPKLKNGKKVEETFYTAPLVPVIKPIENDGWIDWGGGVMPVHEDTLLEVRFSDGGEDGPEPAYSWHWNHIGHSRDVFAYRVIENDGVGK